VGFRSYATSGRLAQRVPLDIGSGATGSALSEHSSDACIASRHPQTAREGRKPWSPYLVDIFTNGLPCMVVKYADHIDRALHEAADVARHDSQSNACRPSSFSQKFHAVKECCRWCGIWVITAQMLERFLWTRGGPRHGRSCVRYIEEVSRIEG
jgi:hypothetical protein